MNSPILWWGLLKPARLHKPGAIKAGIVRCEYVGHVSGLSDDQHPVAGVI